MRLFTNLAFAVLLVLAGAARCWWSESTETITASADKAKIFTLEAIENHKDDRLSSPLLLFSSSTSPYISPFAGVFISQTWEKICVVKDNSRIYKLNSSFLI